MSNTPITVEQAAGAYGLNVKINSHNFSSERMLGEEAFKAGAQWKEQQMKEELGKEMELLDTLIQDGAFNSAAAHIHKLLIKYNSK